MVVVYDLVQYVIRLMYITLGMIQVSLQVHFLPLVLSEQLGSGCSATRHLYPICSVYYVGQCIFSEDKNSFTLHFCMCILPHDATASISSCTPADGYDYLIILHNHCQAPQQKCFSTQLLKATVSILKLSPLFRWERSKVKSTKWLIRFLTFNFWYHKRLSLKYLRQLPHLF